MRKLRNDISLFLSNKLYMIIVCFTAVASYGFTITHPSIGIDDTAIPLYFQDGLAPAVGRWFLYLLNKFISLDQFLPWMTEFVSIVIFIISMTLWCVLWYRLLGEHVPMIGYALFSAMSISCPLISEVFVYYLHNGICIAYGLTTLSLLFLLQAMEPDITPRRKVLSVLAGIVLLTCALGCYESFVIVYIIGILFIFFLVRQNKGTAPQGTKEYNTSVFSWAGVTLLTVAGSVLLRFVILSVLQWIFGYSIPENFTVGYRNVFGNMGQNISDLFMAIKKFWVMYYLNALCYLPITVLVIGLVLLIVLGLKQSIRQKDIFLFLPMLAVPIIPVCMVLIEGMPTHYRASQYVPLIGAFALLMLFKEWSPKKVPKAFSFLGIACAAILVWNQCIDMNRWFYIDYLKYENTKTIMSHIAHDLESRYDISKPIVLRGPFDVPYEISKDAYLSFDSETYKLMKKLADMVDPHLLEKFNAENKKGYVFAETPINSTLRWGITAFDQTATQLEVFWNMHGYDHLKVETDLEIIAEAEQLRTGMPGYPAEGYILETDNYIIVNFNN